MNLPGCVLLDIAGIRLTSEDRELLRHPVCAGLVLFSRNYSNPPQLRELIREIKTINPHAIIAVDQEGGPVQRFRQGFTLLPAMSHWGKLYDQDRQSCYQQLTQAVFVLADELKQAGVNLNLIPVLDLNHGVSQVIGSRSLHQKPEVVIDLASIIIQGLHLQGFAAVGKHFPGHGGVDVDSHTGLPIDSREWSMLWYQDMTPFLSLSQQLDAIMPAHIIFSAVDHRPASFSPVWLQEILRKQFNFQGVIISDDLSMAAAASRGDYAQRAKECFLAGCDLLLVCNNRCGAVAALEALSTCDLQAASLRIAKLFNLVSYP
ncbi:MAG: beta-N-acetylhexosaminidase [Proteobacteria bacterium]|nr:beta-N-acetylhexosaminidase [Pseudomonadota bacterium]